VLTCCSFARAEFPKPSQIDGSHSFSQGFQWSATAEDTRHDVSKRFNKPDGFPTLVPVGSQELVSPTTAKQRDKQLLGN
jgi:hypothetical protein